MNIGKKVEEYLKGFEIKKCTVQQIKWEVDEATFAEVDLTITNGSMNFLLSATINVSSILETLK